MAARRYPVASINTTRGLRAKPVDNVTGMAVVGERRTLVW